ncbi:MAG: CapA family protein [Pelagibacterales bacterium]|nr:CapA family protein [Pelagibacterales bacterium]
MRSKTEIIICGDICPTKDTLSFFEKNNAQGLFNNTLPILMHADILIGNMEFVLMDNGLNATKTGPILRGKSRYVNILKDIGFTLLGLANNHIKDCGADGVLSSLQTCADNNILTVGAGRNEKEAKKPVTINKNGWKIGVMAFAEHEFNAAYSNDAGANLLDEYEDFDNIKEFKETVDYLIILYHGGIEYYEYPSPLLQKKCRKMIDSGADYITCQHSHIIGTRESYKKGTILYGQGNTVFGHRSNDRKWNEGLLIKIELDKKINIMEIPVQATQSGISLVPEKESQIIINKIKDRSVEIGRENFISNSWIQFCNSKSANYLPHLFGLSRILNKLNCILNNKLIEYLFTKKQKMITGNLVRCESHKEIIQTILNKR